MPIEVKELVIRAVVAGKDGETEPPGNNAIVEECVRQVLKILKRSEER